MDTMLISENTVAGKVNTRHGSSDTLTALKPEREGIIDPVAYLRWREHVVALQLGRVMTLRGKRDERSTWISMKKRCNSPSSRGWKYYGGRGIKVCERWLFSFENFYADMGAKPSREHSLDRIDVNGDYEPSNCRWATPKEQCRNRRNNRLVTLNGITKSVAEWVELTGIANSTYWSRVEKGMSYEDAFTAPLHKPKRYLTARGETKEVGAWVKSLGLDRNLVWARILRSDWTPEQILGLAPAPKRRPRNKREAA